MKDDFLKDFRRYFLFASRELFIKIYMKTNPCLEKGCVIDIETTGLNPRKNDYYNPQSHVITLGIYQGDLIRIYQLAKPDYDRFLEICRRIVDKTPQPRYAYAAHFEQKFLEVKEGWQDLTRYIEPDYEWDYYDHPPWFSGRLSLKDVTKGPYESREDWDIEGSEVPSTWEKWLKTKDPRVLSEISYHNYIDLLRERQLI